MAQIQSQQDTPLSCATIVEDIHSRRVQRDCKVFAVPEQIQKKWAGLKAFVVVERSGQRDGAKHPLLGGDRQPFHECQFYICSQYLNAQQLLADTQGHWGIENRLHWVKDVTFTEDFPPRRGGNAPVNWAILHTFFITITEGGRSAPSPDFLVSELSLKHNAPYPTNSTKFFLCLYETTLLPFNPGRGLTRKKISQPYYYEYLSSSTDQPSHWLADFLGDNASDETRHDGF